jgi:hypothetical protein
MLVTLLSSGFVVLAATFLMGSFTSGLRMPMRPPARRKRGPPRIYRIWDVGPSIGRATLKAKKRMIFLVMLSPRDSPRLISFIPTGVPPTASFAS